MDTKRVVEEIQKREIRLESAKDLDAIIQAIGNVDYVLLGEASHGTSEFYTLRMELSKRLIEEKGFSFIAVEGDWPSCYTLNRYVKNEEGASSGGREALYDFNRWPSWMWANREIIELAEWMRGYNEEQRNIRDKVGFYGLDVYSLWESMDAVLKHLKETGSPELKSAKRAFSCFDPYSRDGQSYGVSAAFLSESCEEEVVQLLHELQAKRKRADGGSEAALSDEINTLVAVNAEKYYRTMVRGGNESWNVRDRHMVETLKRLMQFHGTGAKAIVWEHNTHIGDARATDMADDGMINVGQLVREQQGCKQVFAVGFGTHRGTVIAAAEWGGVVETMQVPEAMSGSWEDLLHRAGAYDKMLLFKGKSELFMDTFGHRAIGVVYHPQYEQGNYVPSQMAFRYDAFIYVDETKALEPLEQEVFV